VPPLQFARTAYGAEPINVEDIDGMASDIIEGIDFRGVDASIDAVGFEAKGTTRETVMTDLQPEGYDIFEKAGETCRKVGLTPWGARPEAPIAVEAGFTLPL